MIPELGHYALVLALALGLIQSVAPIIGAKTRDAALMRLATSTALMQFVLVALSFGALVTCYVTSDFSVATVFENSHSMMPLIYKFTSVWGNHEGSMLLWVLILSLFGAFVAAFGVNLPATLKAHVLAVQSWVAVAFYLFILLTSNPFLRLPQAPLEGRDLNPILQDLGLAIHPPLLYLGYVGFSISFSFAIAALIEGRIDAAWARWVRPWTLMAWMFLTVGIAMGSYWAYYTLGWGGFWFWDPVENASLMPWLAGTALLHSAVVMEKRNALKVWTILLAILTFSLSLIGTFLVRSGVLTSVHSFANDPRARRLHPRHSGAVHRRRPVAVRLARVDVEAGRAVRADLARGRAGVQQSLPHHRLPDGVRRHALSSGARSVDRREDFGRRAVLQFDLRSAVRGADVRDAVRSAAGLEARRPARRGAAADDGVRCRPCRGRGCFRDQGRRFGAGAVRRRLGVLRDGGRGGRSGGAHRPDAHADGDRAHARGRPAALDLGHGGGAFRHCDVDARHHQRRHLGHRAHRFARAHADRVAVRLRSEFRWHRRADRPELHRAGGEVHGARGRRPASA